MGEQSMLYVMLPQASRSEVRIWVAMSRLQTSLHCSISWGSHASSRVEVTIPKAAKQQSMLLPSALPLVVFLNFFLHQFSTTRHSFIGKISSLQKAFRQSTGVWGWRLTSFLMWRLAVVTRDGRLSCGAFALVCAVRAPGGRGWWWRRCYGGEEGVQILLLVSVKLLVSWSHETKNTSAPLPHAPMCFLALHPN